MSQYTNEAARKLELLFELYNDKRDSVQYLYGKDVDGRKDMFEMKRIIGVLGSRVDSGFNTYLGKGFIRAYIPEEGFTNNNNIYVSFKWLNNLKDNLVLYIDDISNFWNAIDDYNYGKKIGFTGDCMRGKKSRRGCLGWEDSSFWELF
jgi:hypothetical protein